MSRSLLSRFALTLVLIAGVAGSALSSDTVSNSDTDYHQVFFDITALIFEPAQPYAMETILRVMHLASQADDASGNGQYVLDAEGRTDVLSVLQK